MPVFYWLYTQEHLIHTYIDTGSKVSNFPYRELLWWQLFLSYSGTCETKNRSTCLPYTWPLIWGWIMYPDMVFSSLVWLIVGKGKLLLKWNGNLFDLSYYLLIKLRNNLPTPIYKYINIFNYNITSSKSNIISYNVTKLI